MQPKPLSGEQGEEAPGEAQNTTDGARSKLTQDQRRTLRRQLGNQNKDKESGNPVLEMSAGELKDLQAKDPTLARIQEAAEGKPSLAAGVGFFKRDGLLYRRWTPPGRGEEAQIEQLVLPQECRKTVLELGHQIPLAGHLGKQKTQQRILRRFYWPTVFKDVEEFCRCCVQCQKSTNRRVQQAPLIPLPIISEPFSRIAMDIVGPLPRSRAGNRYVLVLCDYATRYPEAVPLPSTDAEHVALMLSMLQMNSSSCSLRWVYPERFLLTKEAISHPSCWPNSTVFCMSIQFVQVPTILRLTDWWRGSIRP